VWKVEQPAATPSHLSLPAKQPSESPHEDASSRLQGVDTPVQESPDQKQPSWSMHENSEKNPKQDEATPLHIGGV
jgi:hypothetical protein